MWTELRTQRKNTGGANPMKTDSGSFIRVLTSLAVLVALCVPPSAYASDTFTVIEAFPGGASGGPSYSTPISDASGNLYGATVWGGTFKPTDCEYGCGLVYELSPSASGYTENVLYTFAGGADGATPVAGLVFDTVGNLYGTTSAGGTRGGAGTVFELSPSTSGWTKTILYSFTGGNDGSYPESLAFDSAGNLYGAARQGGVRNVGVIFELSPSTTGWIEKTLHVFSGGEDGAYPNVGLVVDAAGNLYGTAANGGNTTASICQRYSGCGVVFELSPSSSGFWKETVLQKFNGGAGGGGPSGLTIDARGNIYVTA